MALRQITLTSEHIRRIREWADALTFGKYRQTSNYLRIDDSYCCLGVACDISGVGEWDVDNFYVTRKGRLEGMLVEHKNYDVKNYYGMDLNDISKYMGARPGLAELNDDGAYVIPLRLRDMGIRSTFKNIAQWVYDFCTLAELGALDKVKVVK